MRDAQSQWSRCRLNFNSGKFSCALCLRTNKMSAYPQTMVQLANDSPEDFPNFVRNRRAFSRLAMACIFPRHVAARHSPTSSILEDRTARQRVAGRRSRAAHGSRSARTRRHANGSAALARRSAGGKVCIGAANASRWFVNTLCAIDIRFTPESGHVRCN